MTLQEASKRFCIDEEKLRFYENNGFLNGCKQKRGEIDYCDEIAEYISLIELFLDAGMDLDSLRIYLDGFGDEKSSKELQIKLLMKYRCKLLDQIHDKQKILDKLDFIIHKTKNKQTEMIL